MKVVVDASPSTQDLKVVAAVVARKLSNELLDSNKIEDAVLTDAELFDIVLPDQNKEAFISWLQGWPYDMIVEQLLSDGYLVRRKNGYQRTERCYWNQEELDSMDLDESMYQLSIMCLQIDSRRFV